MAEVVETNFKEKLAKWITLLTIVGTLVLATIGIIYSFLDDEIGFQGLQYIFGALLPLWGTWIGTILAFYFSKENFESASKNTREILDKVMSTQDKLKSIKIDEVMIPFSQISYYQMPKEAKLETVKLKELRDKMLKENRKRLPVFSFENNILAILHLSTIDNYIANKVVDLQGQQFSFDQLSIKDVEGDPSFNKILKDGFKILNINESLLSAQKSMEATDVCNDVFITQTGKADEPVLGWITNIIISEKAQLK